MPTICAVDEDVVLDVASVGLVAGGTVVVARMLAASATIYEIKS